MVKEPIKKIILSAALFITALCLLSCAAPVKDKDAANDPGVIVPTDPAPSKTAAPTPEQTFTPTPEPAITPTPAPTPDPDAELKAYISGMSVEEKIGQLLLFGFAGTGAPGSGGAALIRKYPVGNIMFYGDNVDRSDGSGGFDTARARVNAFDELYPCSIGRLYAADVEGGSVVRFKWDPALPAPFELGKGSPKEAREIFARVGETLLSCGINLDLAPVFDVSPDPLSTAIGRRMISGDLETVNSIGKAMIDGLHDGGCAACAKHFPGHGGTTEDSHHVTPVVNKSREELYSYDIAAFGCAAENGADCVMAAHILYPALDETDIASMSYPILTGILRQELRFDGVVISDDMLMQGLSKSYPYSEAAVRFILAGGDIVLCGADPAVQEELILSLYEAVENGVIGTERLDESVLRVLRLKQRLGIWEP